MPIIHCACGAEYTVPADWAGKRVKCKRCQAVMTIPSADADTSAGAGPSPLADELAAGGISGYGVGAPLATQHRAAVHSAPGLHDVQPQGMGLSGYWKECLWSFAFFIEPSNAMTFVIVGIIASL